MIEVFKFLFEFAAFVILSAAFNISYINPILMRISKKVGLQQIQIIIPQLSSLYNTDCNVNAYISCNHIAPAVSQHFYMWASYKGVPQVLPSLKYSRYISRLYIKLDYIYPSLSIIHAGAFLCKPSCKQSCSCGPISKA